VVPTSGNKADQRASRNRYGDNTMAARLVAPVDDRRGDRTCRRSEARADEG